MHAVRHTFSRDDITAHLRALGVQAGGVLLVHASFRAVSPVEGGPLGLIEALRVALGPDGTLVMPSMSDDDETPFDRASTSALHLGVVAETFRRLPGVLRGAHAHAFAAQGPEAVRVVSGPLPIPPHGPDSPVGRVHDAQGQVLLLGVGHDANTTLHLAELLAGVPYRVPRFCTVVEGARWVRLEYAENDHCCARFALADDWLRARGLQSEACVGHAPARLARARDIVRVAREHLACDPLVFLHAEGAGCAECDAARTSVHA